MKSLSTILLCCSVFVSASAWTAEIEAPPSVVKEFFEYMGDNRVSLHENPAGCESGFWVPWNAAGRAETVSTIQKAYHAQAKVKVIADDSKRWPETTEQTCEIKSIHLEGAPASVQADTSAPSPERR